VFLVAALVAVFLTFHKSRLWLSLCYVVVVLFFFVFESNSQFNFYEFSIMSFCFFPASQCVGLMREEKCVSIFISPFTCFSVIYVIVLFIRHFISGNVVRKIYSIDKTCKQDEKLLPNSCFRAFCFCIVSIGLLAVSADCVLIVHLMKLNCSNSESKTATMQHNYAKE